MDYSYNLEEERNKHPYNEYGSVKEEVHGNTKFLLKSALRYVIDDFDESISSVELSHYENLGYYEITNFNLLDEVDVLDLTWMKKDDVFCLADNVQYQKINKVLVNIDNLGYSYLPNSSSKRVNLVLISSNSTINIIQQIKNFKAFIQENRNCLESVELIGFPQIIQSLFTLYSKKCGVEIITENKEAKIHR